MFGKRSTITTTLEVCGMVVVSLGVALFSLPAGMIMGGVFLFLIGFLEGNK